MNDGRYKYIYIYECSTRYVISSKGDRCSIKKKPRERERCLSGLQLVGEKKDDNTSKV